MRHVAHHHSRVCCCAIASERRSRGALKTRLRRGVARATRAARAWLGAGFWAVRGEPKRHDETSNKTSKGDVLFFCALAWAASTSLSTSLIGPEREVGAPRIKGGLKRGCPWRPGAPEGMGGSFSFPLAPSHSRPLSLALPTTLPFSGTLLPLSLSFSLSFSGGVCGQGWALGPGV